jgi:hypothetical protein
MLYSASNIHPFEQKETFVSPEAIVRKPLLLIFDQVCCEWSSEASRSLPTEVGNRMLYFMAGYPGYPRNTLRNLFQLLLWRFSASQSTLNLEFAKPEADGKVIRVVQKCTYSSKVALTGIWTCQLPYKMLLSAYHLNFRDLCRSRGDSVCLGVSQD